MTDALELRVLPSIRDIGREAWDGLEGSDAPFTRFAWLDALEQTGCVGEGSGWYPHHLVLSKAGQTLAAAPAYLKTHSQGEFVFDHAWANAAARAGLSYFPKLVVAVPFTPATASRILLGKGADPAIAKKAMAAALMQLTQEIEISSVHVLFPTDAEQQVLSSAGLAYRKGIQFHWRNEGFGDFEDFLKTLPSKKRTQIRRERKELAAQGIQTQTLRGKAIDDEAIEAMFGFYRATVDKFIWGRQYLTRSFFDVIATLPGVEIVLARDAKKRPIAGALNLASNDTLFGRYWGCAEERPFLHFNVCYYHAIEDCIERGLQRFEPGAGGSHKVARGFFPTITHSLHFMGDPGFHRAIADFVERESEAIDTHIHAEWGSGPRTITPDGPAATTTSRTRPAAKIID